MKKVNNATFYTCINIDQVERPLCGIKHIGLASALNHCNKQKGKGWTVRKVSNYNTPFEFWR